MYSKNEASLLRGQFWTAFGMYMAPILSAEGEKINWINYKTGVKGIKFLMTAGNDETKVSITLSHKDSVVQQAQFDIFVQLKNVMPATIGEEWIWQAPEFNKDEGTEAEIFSLLAGINIFEKGDWPAIISFLKPRIILLDKFWCEFKYAFDYGGV